MPSLALNIQFTSADVLQVNEASQKITIVKEVQGTSGSKTVWLTFSPFQTNEVLWETEYGVYASNTEVMAGATINKSSDVVPAQSGVRYPFASGTFGNPQGSIPQTRYGIINNAGQSLTFGLAQSVMANNQMFNGNPLNAVTALVNQEAEFSAIEKVQVYLSGNFNNGVVLSNVSGTALTVDLTDDPTQTIHYDGANGNFVPGPL